ncbi:unnamed protein product [Penicillium glandicola]
MAVRRSARIRRAQNSPDVEDMTPQPVVASRLTSVAEGEETDSSELPHIRTPLTKTPSQKTPRASAQQKRTSLRTPTSVTAARPSREEMHPSKAQQSTTKHADSGLLLGFNPIKKDANGNVVKHSISDNTPTKSKASPATDQFGTPGFEYKFNSQETELSNGAKLLMESVRADAARIKAQMIQEKSNQEHGDHEAEQIHGDRKIAMPKGKASRFSDIHMAEFRKMDSIAGHASSFRATPSRFQPVTKSLKRSKSKAQLDEPDSQNSSPSRSTTKISTLSTPTAATTAKRVKHSQSEDTSTRHESQKDQTQKVETPRRPAGPRPRPRTNVRSSLMTPTHASLARTTSTSIKAPRTSMIPSLKFSPAAKTIASPRTPRTDFNPRLKSKLPTLGSLRSILRRRQPLFSRDPAKIASGTHVAAPDFNPNSLFGGAGDVSDSAPTPSPKKHVEFTPSVKSRHELAVASPSPSKAPSAKRRSMSGDVVYPTLPTLTPEKNSAVSSTTPSSEFKSIRHVRKSDTGEQPASYQELPVVTHGIAHGIVNKKRHRDEVNDEDAPRATNRENVPPTDAQSDERSTKRFKSNPPTPSPAKKRLTKTPVRPSSGRVGTPASKQKSRGVLSMSRLNMLSKPKGHV